MLNVNDYNSTKKNQILLGFAIILSLILCIELAIRAYSFDIEALTNHTGKYLPDFSNRVDKVRTGIEYLGLNLIYIAWLIINRNKNKKKKNNFIKNNKKY